MIRFDLVFSYWILLWHLCYLCKLTKHSPKIAYILGLIENGVLLGFMLTGISTWRNIRYFLIVNFFIKILPFYFVIHDKVHWWSDSIFFITLFVVYLIWLGINRYFNKNIQINTIESVLQNKDITPGMYLLHKLNV